ncbi:uncharacterized protein, partial [Cherax quadricarinatus]|uniref:uncharacterized protein n=1 Tax=Cherax quadricarinatus TaxID=27406 RepID=UPI00387EA500
MNGRSNLFTFSTIIKLQRSNTTIEEKDFDLSATNLTGALETILREIHECQERNIRVFLITDGHHNTDETDPVKVIETMSVPNGKVCNVFVLGIGKHFPVDYSICIRSRLHNGNSNIPSLFWIKAEIETDEQIKNVISVSDSTTFKYLKLSISGFSLPGDEEKNIFFTQEWVYFPFEPEKLKSLSFQTDKIKFHTKLEPCEIYNIYTLKEIFCQWNSRMIQNYKTGLVVPPDTLPLMERLFDIIIEEMKKVKILGTSICERIKRLHNKDLKTTEMEFRTLFKKIRDILRINKFKNEVELAKSILYTTVGGGKYEAKVLKLKGHRDIDYCNDFIEFMKVYEKHKSQILKIMNKTEDCCRITLASTVSDLQDPDFKMMMDLNKFEFLNNFTITGIPVYAPSRDSSLLNPWSYSICNIIGSPHNIMSQIAIENFAKLNDYKKTVEVNWNNENVLFNTIVPVFSPNAAKVMEPIVKTKLYAMCATFALLKNSHIVDFHIHMAALGVTWVRLLFEYPNTPRTEFVNACMKSIEATAALYLNQKMYRNYWNFLKKSSKKNDNVVAVQALMTESIIEVEMKTLKCETLIKPMFILHLNQQQKKNPADKCEDINNLMKIMLVEYMGRCLTHYESTTPF